MVLYGCKVKLLYTPFFNLVTKLKKDLQISELIDIYEGLLTARQSETLRSYYDYDLSLSEIAENEGVTRQAVRDTIVKACEQLVSYEQKLALKVAKDKIVKQISIAIKLLNEEKSAEAIKVLDELLTNF